MFDKKQYWENRKKGIRGQGEEYNRIEAYHTPEEWKEIKRKEKENKLTS